MRFFLDHDVPAEIGRVLHREGHDVVCVSEVMPPTATDRSVLHHAISDGRILITCNRDDFLALANELQHAGLIVLVRRRSRMAECGALLRLLVNAGSRGLDRNINFA